MKKFFINMALTLALLLPVAANAAEGTPTEKRGPVELLTGEIWQKSEPGNKKAWLFGIDTAVDIEKAVSATSQKNKKGQKFTLSPFARGWLQAFGNAKIDDTVALIDQWYAANPDKLDRPVMDMIWYEIVVPRTIAK